MYNIVTSSNTTLPVGMVQDYNNTDPSLAVTTYRTETSASPMPAYTTEPKEGSFAQAIYGDGPYSLNHPNSTSDVLCQNIDYIA